MLSNNDASMNMTLKERVFYVLMGFAILFIFIMPFIPNEVWTIIQLPLVTLLAGIGTYVAGSFIMKGIRGRW